MEIFINRSTGLFPCLCSTAAEIGSSIPVRLKGIQRHLKMVGWHLEMLGAISTNPIDSIKVCSDGEATDTVWGLLTWVLSGNKAASQQLRKENTPCTNSHSTHKPKKKENTHNCTDILVSTAFFLTTPPFIVLFLLFSTQWNTLKWNALRWLTSQLI